MGRTRNLILVGLALSGLISCIHGQQPNRAAQVPIPEVIARTGYSANFTCESYREPLAVCLWERKGSPFFLSFLPGTDRSGLPSSTAPGYSYTGDGLDRGSCGLVISIVKDEDRAQWECKLVPFTGQPFTGMVDLKILKKPSRPHLDDEGNRLKNLLDPEVSRVDQGIDLTCYAEGGQPQPQFKWFIGDMEIVNRSPVLDRTTNDSRNFTGQKLTGYTFTREHNGLDVRCVLIHETVSEYEQQDYTASQRVIVQFPPRAVDRFSPAYVTGVGERAIIAVNISSNPSADIQWLVGNDPPLAPDNTRPRYQAHRPIAFANHSGLFEYRLEIFKLEEEDLEKTYRLRAHNQLGAPIELEIRLSTASPEAAGLSAGGIVGLVLGIPAILIIIAIIVVYTRAKGLLCFKGNDGTASEKERMDGDGGESAAGTETDAPAKPKETEQVPVTRRLQTRLSALYENLQNLKPKKKDKTAPIDEEAGKDKQDKDKETAPATETAPAGTDEKKPDDIVYAELDLTLDTNLKVETTAESKDKSPAKGGSGGSPKK